MYTTLFLSLDWQHLLIPATFVSHTHIHTHTYTHTHWFVHLCLVLRMALGDGLREPVKNHRGRGRMDISGTVLAQPCTPGWVCEHSICLCPLSELSLCQAGSGIRRGREKGTRTLGLVVRLSAFSHLCLGSTECTSTSFLYNVPLLSCLL